MARSGTDSLVKKNSKLETFLKKKLDPDTFERIRCYDSCIVCSEREDKAFKYVVVGDEWIFLTENPPKKVYEAVHLKDVISVELVNDFPDFLSGDERENVQHVVVKYKAPLSKTKRKDKSGSLTSRSNGNLTSRSVRTQPESSQRLSLGPSNFYLSGSQTARDVRSTRPLSSRLSGSLDASVLRELLHNKTAEHDSSSSGLRRGQSHSSSWPSKMKSAVEVSGDQVDGRPPSGRRHSSASLSSLGRPLPTSARTSSSSKITPHNTNSLTVPNGQPSHTNGRRPRSTSGGSRRGSVHKTDSIEEEDYLPPPLELGISDEEDDDVIQMVNFQSRRSSTAGSEYSDEGDNREGVLHLYIMYGSSNILVLTKCAWRSYLLRATMLFDPDYQLRDQERREAPGHSEKLELLFSQLKRELLNPDNHMDENFALVSELQTAAEKNFAIKKLFWKTPELFRFITSELKLYLPRSPFPRCSTAQRTDEFKYINLLGETLAQSFRETEIMPSRQGFITASRGRFVLDLITTMTCTPVIPQSPLTVVCVNDKKVDTPATCQADAQMKLLLHEFTIMASTIIYELSLIADQARCVGSENSFFNVSWMVKSLEEATTIEAFVNRLIDHVMKLMSPSKLQLPLSPVEALQVYQQFHLLHMLVEYSPRLLLHIRNNFYEEFKYYMQVPVILEKVPKEYPISQDTLKLMSSVMSSVLQTDITVRHL